MEYQKIIYKYGPYFSIVFAILVFLILSFALRLPAHYLRGEFMFSDVDNYLEAVDLFYNHHFTPQADRPWGYAAILGLPHLFSKYVSVDTLLTYSVIINLLAYLGSVSLIYRIASKWFDAKQALISTCLFVLMFSNSLMVYQAMTETIFIFFLILAVYQVQTYIHNLRKTHLLIALFCICFTAIMRPVTYPLSWMSLILCIGLVRRQFSYVLYAIVIFTSTIGVQLYLMNRHFELKTISVISSYTLYHYLGARVEAPDDEPFDYAALFKKREAIAYQFARQDSIEHRGKDIYLHMHRTYKRAMKTMIKDRPADVLMAFVGNLFSNCTDGCSVIPFLEKDDGNSFYTVTKRGVWLLTIAENILASIFCVVNMAILCILAFRNRFRLSKGMVFACLLQFLCIYFLFTSGISFWQGDRFNYPWYGLAILISIYLTIRLFGQGSLLKGKTKAGA